jgi:hypothetical protein
MKSTITHLMAACLLLAAFGPPAAELSRAQGLGSPPQPFQFTAVLPDTICGFAVDVTIAGKSGVIFLPGGDVLVTAPALYGTFTNHNDPSKSVTLNITGPAFVVSDNGQTTTLHGLGRGAAWGPSFGLHLFVGNWTFALDDATGFLVQPPTGTGQMIDICGLIN